MRRRDENGSVAVLVLWGAALIFILLAAANFTSRTEIAVARNAIAAARARHAAEGGTQLGLERLLARRAQGTMIFDGRKEPWQDTAAKLAISIQDEAGKIDINQAAQPFLAGLFTAVGRKPEEARLLSCRILERRGSASPACPAGPLGTSTLFAAPEELAALPGFGDRLYAAISDYVTVQTGASAIDPMVASRTVLMAVPGASKEIVDEFLANRRMLRDLTEQASGFGTLPASPYLMMSPAREFTVSAVAVTDGARYRADLQLRLTGMANRPYEVLAWRAPPP